MARRLGIGDRFEDSNEGIRKSFVFARGRLHELPEGIILMVPTRMVPFALSSLMTWPGKGAHGHGPRAAARRRGARRRQGTATRASATSCGGASGVRALARIAEPIVAGIHAGDPEQMSVRATFPMFLEMERQHRSLILAMLKRRKARQKAAAAGGRPAAAARARRRVPGAARARTSTRSRAVCRS